MQLESLSQIGDFLGGIGVIVSLVYVALQVRDNTEAQRNDIEARTLERLGSMQREMAVNPELCALYNKGLRDTKKLDLQEKIRFTWWCTEFFSAIEFLHQKHRQGMISEGIWWRWDQTFRWWLCFPGIVTYWESKPTPFSPEFSSYVESAIRLGYTYERPGAWDAFLGSGTVKSGD